MKNIKEIGNEYEQHICEITREMLGVNFKPTQRSGGAFHKGDIRDWRSITSLSKYCIELKCHETQNAFNKELRSDLMQALSQTPANKNWMLITALPNTNIDLAISDYKDYLCNDVLGQMVGGNREDAIKEISEMEDLIYKLRKKIEALKIKL